MITVLGFDQFGNARAVEVVGSKEEIQQLLESEGWTDLILLGQ